MQSTCDVGIRQLPDAAVVELTGELNASASGVLGPAYEEAVRDTDPRSVILDFTAVDYINSTGIALVVGVLARARAEARTLIAVGLSDHYREIFSLIRLDEAIGIHDDASAAVAASRG